MLNDMVSSLLLGGTYLVARPSVRDGVLHHWLRRCRNQWSG
jgi:hypothetical protein